MVNFDMAHKIIQAVEGARIATAFPLALKGKSGRGVVPRTNGEASKLDRI